MGHAHGPAPSFRTRRLLAVLAGVLAAGTLIGLVMLWPGADAGEDVELGLTSRVYDVEVVTVTRGPCAHTTEAQNIPCQRVQFRPTQGPNEGERLRFELPITASSPDLDRGDHIVMSFDPKAEPGFRYQFVDRQRRSALLWLTVIFAVAVIALGRWRGVAALVGLGATIAVLIRFVLPALVDGASPVLVAIVGASAIAFLALYLAHGFRSMTTVALLGTLGALAVTVALAWFFTEAARFSGFTSEEAFIVQLGTKGGVDLAGLVLAGMVLGALGALDDVTVTQASAVWELRGADPGMSRRELRRAGLRIGRDHVASTVNTLALAYAGAALPLLVLFVLSRQSLGTVANSEIVATEIVATLVGSIGLVTAVPLTTWLAAALAPGRPGPPQERPGPPDGVPTGVPTGGPPGDDTPDVDRDVDREGDREGEPSSPAPTAVEAADRDEADFWRS